MRVAISGSTGLVGNRLVERLREAGLTPIRITRGGARDGTISWDPYAGEIDRAALEGLDAVVHLSGENVAGGRWTASRKQAILDSRVITTRVLCEALAELEQKPAVLVCASANGYYGDTGDTAVDESAPAGDTFLADVCVQWEAAAEPARAAGIRVAHLRIGIVLSPEGGALAQMLTPFRLGLGGVVGGGDQYMSWITLDDVVGAFLHCIETPSLEGPVNGVGPNPTTNRAFTKALGTALGRPTVFPVPALAVKAAFGEMGEALLLPSLRCVPRRLEESGYTFQDPELLPALKAML